LEVGRFPKRNFAICAQISAFNARCRAKVINYLPTWKVAQPTQAKLTKLDREVGARCRSSWACMYTVHL